MPVLSPEHLGDRATLRERRNVDAVHAVALDEPRHESRRFRFFDEGG
jgi:hypothetical protein